MELQRNDSLCPLCKNPATASASASVSRLCEQCRSLVSTILPKANSNRPFSINQYSGLAAAVAEPVAASEPVFIESDCEAEAPARLDTNPLPEFYAEPQVDSSYYELEEAAPEADDYRPSDYYVIDQPAPEAAQEATAYEAAAHEAVTYEAATEEARAPAPVAQPALAASEKTADKVDEPDWDYTTVNEWPLMIKSEPRKSGIKSGVIAAAAMAFVMACVFGGYFLLYRANSSSGEASANPAAAAPAQPAQADRQEPTASAQPATAEAAQASPLAQASAPAQADAIGEAQRLLSQASGTISLQVASFPDQAAANEFNEKLARAGIQGYVVAADLGKRGKWFRVRVGRFESAAAANQYAAEARERAKAAGMTIELMVCDYEQP